MSIKYYNHLGLFYALSTVIPWALWFGVAHLSHAAPNEYPILVALLGLLGLLAPLIIAFILILPNEVLRKDVFGRLFKLRGIRMKYLLAIFLLMPASILTAQLISLVFGYGMDQFQIRGSFTFTSGVFPVWILLIVAPLIEELAWHSYGTDCIRNRFNLLNTSVLFALFWGVWHFPLSFVKDYYHSNIAASGLVYSINFFLSLFPFVLIMNWLYYKTNRNIVAVIVFHISAGYFNEIFATHPMSKVIQTLIPRAS